MKISNLIKEIFKPRIKLDKGTRLVSFFFIGISVMIAAGFMLAANTYYNIDTGEIVMEEIQRVTQTVRATYGVIVAGTATEDLDSGVTLQVATGTVSLSGEDQILRFTGGGSYYTGFRATTTMTTSTVYYLPTQYAAGADYVLTWQSGNQLEWKVATSTGGVGDITAVGDVTSGDAFTSGGTGSSLYFHSGANTGRLTVATLTGNATYTLPNLSGTVALSTSTLSAGGLLFPNSSGLIIQDANNLYWATSTGRLGIGTSSPSYTLDVAGAIRSGVPGTNGQLRIYSEQGGTDYEVIFNPTSTMTQNTTYYLPPNDGSSGWVLTTDGGGVLTWAAAAGGLSGTGQQNYLAKWTDASTLSTSSIIDAYSGGTVLTIDASGTTTIANNLVVSGSGGVSSVLFTGSGSVTYTSGGTTTISSAGSSDIILDPASGKITLGASDYIETSGGYTIGESGTEVLREMIPIFGFDLPAQTATTSYVQISRTIQDYPFVAAATGATRIHKFIIRYTDALGTASSSDWRVATSGGAVDTFSLGGSNDSSLDSGRATTTGTIAIPTNGNDWWLEVKSQAAYPSYPVKVFQIFLAAYDVIN